MVCWTCRAKILMNMARLYKIGLWLTDKNMLERLYSISHKVLLYNFSGVTKGSLLTE